MAALRHTSHRVLMTALALGALTAGLLPAVADTLTPPEAQASAGPQSCVNGVIPLNPYVVNCNLPRRGNQVIGAAPDAGALIACRHSPTCISYYVNYPGTLIVPGYPSY